MAWLRNRPITADHLDVGVRTGYCLDRCRFPDPRPRLALLDLNPNSLRVAAHRLARFQPEVYRANVLSTRAGRPTTQTLSNSRAWATPGAGRPHSLAVTRASATSCRHRKAGRVRVNSSRTVR